MLPAWRPALPTVGFGDDEGMLITAGWLHASHAAVRLLRVSGQLAWRVGPSPRVVGWEPWSTSVEALPVTLGGASEEICL
jgi:hypothetical protein